MSAPYAWYWNAPRPAPDPSTFGKAPRITELARQIAYYTRSDQRAEALRRAGQPPSACEIMINRALERDLIRDKELKRTEEDRRAARRDRDNNQVVALLAMPDYLREPLMQRLRFLRKKQHDAEQGGKKERPASAFLHGQLNRIFKRVERIDTRFRTPAYQYVTAKERLDALLDLPRLTKREIQTAATLTAGAIEGEFNRLCDLYGVNFSLNDALEAYQNLARTVFKLNVTPAGWEALRTDNDRRSEPDLEQLPGAIARLTCANWWQRKLWRLRRIWREEQLRAAGMVSKTTSVYLSRDALTEHRDQRRRMRDFLKSYELVNEDGFTIDLEDAYYAGNSNPKHRRFEMMTTMKGMENIAEARGDEAVFLTVTCPSRFHATLESGPLNPKWDGSTVRDSSDYLVNVFFAGVRKKLNRKKLRWYGVRVAEPHHDGTVHWHMMIFARPDEREAIVDIVREFAIREDRAELGDDITPRFESELITKEKGTPTSYIATYIGKNVDGAAVGGIDPKTGQPRVDNDSGKSMADSVEHAIGWTGLHGVRQFQFFGIPSRQAYRELRRLAVQMSRQKDGPAELPDKSMDNVLVAADAGCFASYINSQGGVLIPRKDYLIRTAYDVADKLNDYGEAGIQIFGIWAPALGEESRVCTHPDNWVMVRKRIKSASEEALKGVDPDLRGGPDAPWTRGNNCPPEQNSDKSTDIATQEIKDFGQMTRHERRELLKRLRSSPPPGSKESSPPTKYSQPVHSSPPPPQLAARASKVLDILGIYVSERLVEALSRGSSVHTDKTRKMFMDRNGSIRFVNLLRYCKKCSHEVSKNNEDTPDGCQKCTTIKN
ncbi:replication endonuclease [Erwinia tracheiphila]|uniref:Replication endonuclease n=1 Tax=Erwinia tracheiphila TaxID=65700 RepID=A0A345CVK8_9GAMM|nr:replication endonuclease [Erwinia tracheiphila]AXF77475.1 replication endonuclease [Erwinia tracheiphila]UIA83830.1 replication endonuclease [Erwinia tracheiphila]UIA89593.1 replication endonuclease [Erwinia tracheiphila]UIA98341.1 replication endonuclease [Erwinia tracheiphila]